MSHTETVGQEPFSYLAVPDWPQLPDGWSFIEAVGIAVDSQDRVFVFNRGEHPVIVFDRDGQFLYSWGEGLFARPHGITIGTDDCVFCVDDFDHTVKTFTTDGQLLMTIGTSGQPSYTGATSTDYRNIRRAGPPFHYPTNLVETPSGELYIADGYGNARIHKFSADGQLLFSWGEPGAGPGQFHIPHGIAIDQDGMLYVADRENSRIQRFAPDGSYIDEWNEIARPCQVFIDPAGCIFVAELGYRAGMFPGNEPPVEDVTGGRVSVFDADGQLLSCWGGGLSPGTPGDFYAPHDILVDSHGDIYVAEVIVSAARGSGYDTDGFPSLQKFARQV